MDVRALSTPGDSFSFTVVGFHWFTFSLKYHFYLPVKQPTPHQHPPSLLSQSSTTSYTTVLTGALHDGGAGGLADLVEGPARELATVLRVHRRDLQDDEAEVTERAEPAGCLHWLAVVVPLGLRKGANVFVYSSCG